MSHSIHHFSLPVISLVCLFLFASAHASAQDGFRTIEVQVPQGQLALKLEPTEYELPEQDIVWWVRRSARAVATYYGRFPLDHATIRLVSVDGKGIKGGRAFGHDGGFITVNLGRESDRRDLVEDWVMVHEMVHLAFPRLNERHNWLSEGLAVYVESVARLQIGDLKPGFVWRGFAKGMEHGLPRKGDKGLDFTPTWGRTYWGGAIFCLLADIEIQRRTDGKQTLREALRGVLDAGGDFESHWPIHRSLEAADRATGTTVLMDLYEAWRASPIDPDLPGLWKRLGVRVKGKTATFDDTANLAQVRKRIGEPPKG